ncbi:MAG TPA: hypothetical protein VG477_16370 [Thermoanaerobaculia bacterium]|nr:hypothetical protein [Thermoanaerobaculia bacterium]
MTRAIPTWMILVLALLPLAARAQEAETLTDAPAQAQIQTELRLERRLLSLDLVTFNEIRERERRARERVNGILDVLDETMAGDSLSLGGLETLHDELSTAREAARTAEGKLDSHLERLQERLRRIGLLEAEVAGGGARRLDPVSGRWRVTILPQNRTAIFDLRLNGTVVSGTYEVSGSTPGSFRGTYSGARLRLERIDSEGGFDSVWEAIVGENTLSGAWQSNQLVTGQPTRGDWTAVRESEP